MESDAVEATAADDTEFDSIGILKLPTVLIISPVAASPSSQVLKFFLKWMDDDVKVLGWLLVL